MYLTLYVTLGKVFVTLTFWLTPLIYTDHTPDSFIENTICLHTLVVNILITAWLEPLLITNSSFPANLAINNPESLVVDGWKSISLHQLVELSTLTQKAKVIPFPLDILYGFIEEGNSK